MGKPSVVSEKLFQESVDLKQFYLLAASAEKDTDHPLSYAIMDKAHQVVSGTVAAPSSRDMEWVPVTRESEVRAGLGVICSTEAKSSLAALSNAFASSSCLSDTIKVTIGNRQLMEEEQIELPTEVCPRIG